MTTSATRPRIQDLPPAERREAYAEAAERAMDAAHETAVEYKARTPDPRSTQHYRDYLTMGLACILVVKHRDKPASIEVSPDGGWPHIYLPVRKIIVQPESTEDFILALIPKRFLAWLAQQDQSANQTARRLMGITPELTGAWTDAQHETWRALCKLRLSINSKIYSANRRPGNAISRGNAA